MSADMDPSHVNLPGHEQIVRLPRSPRLSGSSPQRPSPSGSRSTVSSSAGGTSGRLSSSQYRPRSRSLASASLIPPASSYSPGASSSPSTNRHAPPLSLPPPAAAQQSPSTRRRIRTTSSGSSGTANSSGSPRLSPRLASLSGRRIVHDPVTRAQAKNALQLNDSMVYLDGPQVYACQQCRTHLTSHDDIISKSFHGRRGRAYLFDQCVNVTTGPPEDRLLITGMHSVSDIFCQRCNTLVGWTYKRAYEASQKYKEGKYIIEKINLYLEESDTYSVQPPAGERRDRWRQRSQSWGSEDAGGNQVVYEYAPP